MFVAVISAPCIPSDATHVRFGLVEAMAVSEVEWQPTVLGCPQGDSLCTVAEQVAKERGLEWHLLPSLDSPGAVDILFKTAEALLVVTDGSSYAMAEYAKRGRMWLDFGLVHERVIKWEQGELW